MDAFFSGLIPVVAEYGGIGLFLFCALSASIIPVRSEAALVAVMEAHMDPWEALAWASAGNCLGILLNYWIGYLTSDRILAKLREGRTGRTAIDWADRWGKWALLLSWAPFIGDPLTFAAGAFRMNLPAFILIACTLRIARYVLFTLFYV